MGIHTLARVGMSLIFYNQPQKMFVSLWCETSCCDVMIAYGITPVCF